MLRGGTRRSSHAEELHVPGGERGREEQKAGGRGSDVMAEVSTDGLASYKAAKREEARLAPGHR